MACGQQRAGSERDEERFRERRRQEEGERCRHVERNRPTGVGLAVAVDENESSNEVEETPEEHEVEQQHHGAGFEAGDAVQGGDRQWIQRRPGELVPGAAPVGRHHVRKGGAFHVEPLT